MAIASLAQVSSWFLIFVAAVVGIPTVSLQVVFVRMMMSYRNLNIHTYLQQDLLLLLTENYTVFITPTNSIAKSLLNSPHLFSLCVFFINKIAVYSETQPPTGLFRLITLSRFVFTCLLSCNYLRASERASAVEQVSKRACACRLRLLS